MAEILDAPTPLAPQDATRLLDFARACKSAARAVTLYPPTHPAITTALQRIADVTSERALAGPLRMAVLPDRLLVGGRAPAQPDASLADLAAILHQHLIGELTVQPGGDAEAWRMFLQLVGRAVDSVRIDGGIARAWTTMGGRHVEIREIDYAEILRERTRGEAATWDRIVNGYMRGDPVVLDEELTRALIEIAGDAEQLAKLVNTMIEERPDAAGAQASAGTLLRMVGELVAAVSTKAPERVETVLKNLGAAVTTLTANGLLSFLQEAQKVGGETAEVVSRIVERVTSDSVARFVARDVIAEGSATDRLAQAFQTLVADPDARDAVLAQAREEVASSPLGATSGFDGMWEHVAEKLLRSYKDEEFVPDAYARELSSAKTRAIDVEHASDDPPVRMRVWLGTVATTELRSLDLTLLLDLLRIEEHEERWSDMVPVVVLAVEDLLLVGDTDAAAELMTVLASHAAPPATKERRQHALIGLDLLVAGPMLRHLREHLPIIDEAHYERLKAACLKLGEVFVKPLAEMLATEEVGRARERLTGILIAFGAVGRRTIERLKSSPNAAVRRTAIYLMREFGGSEALPDLTELLTDAEPQVQREAVRAILTIGTERAYGVLQEALVGGSADSRNAIMVAVAGVRDERATPLLLHILRHVDYRGGTNAIYLRAVEALGVLKDGQAVEPLKELLYRGDWWAPRRTTALRQAAAAALARIGSGDATAALHEAAQRGSRGVRAAVRPFLAGRRART